MVVRLLDIFSKLKKPQPSSKKDDKGQGKASSKGVVDTKKTSGVKASDVKSTTTEPETIASASLSNITEKVVVQKEAAVKVEDERSMAMAGAALSFANAGQLLTAPGGPLNIPEESRGLCALFENGLWLVSASHRHSPLVTSVAQMAKRQGLSVDNPRYVTPNIINQAYLFSDRSAMTSQADENTIRRKIVYMLEKAVEMAANDIHIEAVNGRTRIEFRVDGALRVWETWTQREGEQALSAIYSHSIGSGSTANWSEPIAAMLTSDTKGKEIIALPKGVISVRCQWVPLANDGRYLDMRSAI